MEPGSDILFMQNLMFTACYGGQVKGWERLKPQPIPPEPPAPTQGPPAPPVLAAPQRSTPRAAAAAAASVQEEGLRDQHRRHSQEGAPPRQRAPTSPAAIIRTPPLPHASGEQETGAAQSAAALYQ